MVRFIDVAATNALYRQELVEAFTRVLDSGRYVLGEEVRAFEKEFAAYCGIGHAIGVGNGLGALTLVLRAWKELGRLGDGDEVLVPANTFIATVLAVTENGLKPVLIEPDPRTLNMDIARIEQAITGRTRVILPVHLYGLLADMPVISAISQRRGLLVLEDAAQAHGAMLAGRRAGSWGSAAAFSFYPTKNPGALGDAGAATTDDPDVAEMIGALRNTGSGAKYLNQHRGLNSRLDEVQAAFLRVKLAHLDSAISARRRVADVYGARIVNDRIVKPPAGVPGQHVWHLYVVRTPARDRLQKHLAARGVETLIHYPIPPHRQNAYREYQHLALPITERLAAEVLSLPIGPTMSEDGISTVVEAVNSFAG